MRNYELTLVLSGEATAAKKKSLIEKIEKIVSVNKGKIGKIADWGKKDLAFKIGKNTSGVYLHFPLELGAVAAREVGKQMKVLDEVIRYLLVKID